MVGLDVTPTGDPNWLSIRRVAISFGTLCCARDDILHDTADIGGEAAEDPVMPMPMQLPDNTIVIQGPAAMSDETIAHIEQHDGWVGPLEAAVITRGAVLRAVALRLPIVGRVEGHTLNLDRLRRILERQSASIDSDERRI